MSWQQTNASKHPELHNLELDSTVGTVTDLREENLGFDSQQRQMTRSALRPNWSASLEVPWILSSAVEWPEVRLRLTTHLPLLSRLRTSGDIPPFP